MIRDSRFHRQSHGHPNFKTASQAYKERISTPIVQSEDEETSGTATQSYTRSVRMMEREWIFTALPAIA
jgi:hypothetical protein